MSIHLIYSLIVVFIAYYIHNDVFIIVNITFILNRLRKKSMMKIYNKNILHLNIYIYREYNLYYILILLLSHKVHSAINNNINYQNYQNNSFYDYLSNYIYYSSSTTVRIIYQISIESTVFH